MTPHQWAAGGTVLAGLLLCGSSLLPTGGSYPVPTTDLTLALPAEATAVLPASLVGGPLYAPMVEDRKWNPFSLQEETHRQQLRRLNPPPPPVLDLPEPLPLPLP